MNNLQEEVACIKIYETNGETAITQHNKSDKEVYSVVIPKVRFSEGYFLTVYTNGSYCIGYREKGI